MLGKLRTLVLHPYPGLEQFQPIFDIAASLWLLVFLYFVVYKSPLSILWWRVVAPVLEPLGFRHVCMDMRFRLYSVRYVGLSVDDLS